jgi:hypothetical protein
LTALGTVANSPIVAAHGRLCNGVKPLSKICFMLNRNQTRPRQRKLPPPRATGIHIQSTAICNRAIASDSRATGIDAQTIAADGSTIATAGQTTGIYLQTIAADSQTIATNIQAMLANIGEIHSCRRATASRRLSMAGNSGFPHKSE